MSGPGIDELTPLPGGPGNVFHWSALPHRDRSRRLLAHLANASRQDTAAPLRALVIRKSENAHHLKYGVAALEDGASAQPETGRLLTAACACYLPGADGPDREDQARADRALAALGI